MKKSSRFEAKPQKPGFFHYFVNYNKAMWLHFRTDAPTLSVNGEKLPLEKFRGAGEAFFYAVPGRNRIEAAAGALLTIRQVPEIFVFAFDPAEKTDHDTGTIDMDFWKKYLFPSVNTVNIASSWYGSKKNPSWSEVMAVKASGRRVIGSGGFHAKKWCDAQAMYDDMRTSYPVINLWGRALDEIRPTRAVHIAALSRALHQMSDHESLIYTWVLLAGQMDDPQYHDLLISAQSNASMGRGKLLNECYIRTYPTMEEQLAKLHRYRDNVGRTSEFYPGYTGHILMIGGAYAMPGGFCCAIDPEVDTKYVQDMFFNLLANDPVFDGLYGMGMYSIGSADEELKRWYGELFRHYGIEGRKDMLSDRYGFSFIPGHLKNGDFAEDLTCWQPTGDVKAEKIKGYGEYQGRKRKDSVAVLAPDSSLSQKITNLTPGKYYALMYTTAYRSEAEERRAATRHEHLDVTLSEDVKVIDTHTLLYPIARKRAYTTHKIIFLAVKPEVTVNFEYRKEGGNGKSVILNWVSVKPYFISGGTAEK